MSAQIYIIEQIEDARSHEERYAYLVNAPFAIVMSYQSHISRILRARDDQRSLLLLDCILSFLRASAKGRADAFQTYLRMIPE